MVNHILSNELDFREYLLPYTNAATIVTGDFQDTEDLDGLFSGYNPDKAVYNPASWHYEGMEPHRADDETSEQARELAAGLQHESGGPALRARRPAAGPDAAAPALRLPDPQAALRPLHARGRRGGLRRTEGAVPRGRQRLGGRRRPGGWQWPRRPGGWQWPAPRAS